MDKKKIPYVLGRTGTADAMYRETRGNFEKHKQDGCIAVEMECSAVQAVCDFRGIEFYNFLKSCDLLDAPQWDSRSEFGINGSAIGNISVINIKDRNCSAELGYCMGYDYWNKGYMTEAARAVIDFLFKDVGMHRIAISHAVKNHGSGRVAQKCGLTFEGIKRKEALSSFGEYLDVAVYAVLQDEWENKK